MQCGHRRVADCEENLRMESEQLPGVLLRKKGIAVRDPIFHPKALAEHPTLLL
jgi:hypothetical protein